MIQQISASFESNVQFGNKHMTAEISNLVETKNVAILCYYIVSKVNDFDTFGGC